MTGNMAEMLLGGSDSSDSENESTSGLEEVSAGSVPTTSAAASIVIQTAPTTAASIPAPSSTNASSIAPPLSHNMNSSHSEISRRMQPPGGKVLPTPPSNSSLGPPLTTQQKQHHHHSSVMSPLSSSSTGLPPPPSRNPIQNIPPLSTTPSNIPHLHHSQHPMSTPRASSSYPPSSSTPSNQHVMVNPNNKPPYTNTMNHASNHHNYSHPSSSSNTSNILDEIEPTPLKELQAQAEAKRKAAAVSSTITPTLYRPPSSQQQQRRSAPPSSHHPHHQQQPKPMAPPPPMNTNLFSTPSIPTPPPSTKSNKNKMMPPMPSVQSNNSSNMNNNNNQMSSNNPNIQLTKQQLQERELESKRRKEHFLMFTRVLMKYLEQKDKKMHHEAKNVIKICAEKNKKGDPAYASLSVSMQRTLRELVGENYWKKAEEYLKTFLRSQYIKKATENGKIEATALIVNEASRKAADKARKAADPLPIMPSSVMGASVASSIGDLSDPSYPHHHSNHHHHQQQQQPLMGVGSVGLTTNVLSTSTPSAFGPSQRVINNVPPPLLGGDVNNRDAVDMQTQQQQAAVAAAAKKKELAAEKKRKAKEKRDKAKQAQLQASGTPSARSSITAAMTSPFDTASLDGGGSTVSTSTAGKKKKTIRGGAALSAQRGGKYGLMTTNASGVVGPMDVLGSPLGTTSISGQANKGVKSMTSIVPTAANTNISPKKVSVAPPKEYAEFMEMIDHAVNVDSKSSILLLGDKSKKGAILDLTEEQNKLLHLDSIFTFSPSVVSINSNKSVPKVTAANKSNIQESDVARITSEDSIPLLPSYLRGWGERNLLSSRIAWAKLRLVENDLAKSPSLSLTRTATNESTSNIVFTESDDDVSFEPSVWFNEEKSEEDAALALISESTQLYVKKLLEGAINIARRRLNLDGIRLWHHQHTMASSRNISNNQNVNIQNCPLFLRLGCDVRRQYALSQGNAAKIVKRMEEALSRRTEKENILLSSNLTKKENLYQATSMTDLATRPHLPSAASRADYDAKRNFEIYGGKDSNDPPLGQVPKKAKLILNDFKHFIEDPSYIRFRVQS